MNTNCHYCETPAKYWKDEIRVCGAHASAVIRALDRIGELPAQGWSLMGEPAQDPADEARKRLERIPDMAMVYHVPGPFDGARYRTMYRCRMCEKHECDGLEAHEKHLLSAHKYGSPRVRTWANRAVPYENLLTEEEIAEAGRVAASKLFPEKAR